MAVSEMVKKLNEAIEKGISRARVVNYTLYGPDAKSVYLAGDFNAWNTNSHLMKKGPDGMWRLSVRLPIGRHEYKFYVDGTWSQQFPCSAITYNTYGTYNCVIGLN